MRQYPPVREKTRVNTRGKRRETARGCWAEGTSSTPRLANSLAASLPGKNECPGTHCSLIVKEKREESFCQICQTDRGKKKDGGENRVARTKSEMRRAMADLLVLPRPAGSLQNGAGISGKT